MTRATVIDWRALIQPCAEIVRPHVKTLDEMTQADWGWESDYHQRLYQLAGELVPPATIKAYAETELAMAERRNTTTDFDDQSAESQAFDAIKHVCEWRALFAPADDVADVVARLEYAAELDDQDGFPDAMVSIADLLRTALADLRRFGAVPK